MGCLITAETASHEKEINTGARVTTRKASTQQDKGLGIAKGWNKLPFLAGQQKHGQERGD